MSKKYLADFITYDEYKCRHCGRLPVDFYNEGLRRNPPEIYEIFFETYENFRRPWGKPIPWSSGYRCLYWNKKSGGSDLSVHIFGLAGDLTCKDNKEMEELYQCILEYNSELRLGKYRGRIIKGKKIKPWIHWDIGYWIVPRLRKEWHKMARWKG